MWIAQSRLKISCVCVVVTFSCAITFCFSLINPFLYVTKTGIICFYYLFLFCSHFSLFVPACRNLWNSLIRFHAALYQTQTRPRLNLKRDALFFLFIFYWFLRDKYNIFFILWIQIYRCSLYFTVPTNCFADKISNFIFLLKISHVLCLGNFFLFRKYNITRDTCVFVSCYYCNISLSCMLGFHNQEIFVSFT